MVIKFSFYPILSRLNPVEICRILGRWPQAEGDNLIVPRLKAGWYISKFREEYDLFNPYRKD